MSLSLRNRVRELRLVKANELLPNPKNWRTHPTAQVDALKGLLAEVGIAGAVLVRELPDGRLMLIDGHARADLSGDNEIPVQVLDVSEEEADKILATFDSVGKLAETNEDMLKELLEGVEFDSPAVNEMLEGMLGDTNDSSESEPATTGELKESFQILILCKDEAEQASLLERFATEGLECRSLIS